MKNDKALVFNWQKEDQKNRGSFLSWMFLALFKEGELRDDKLFGRLSDATDRFTKIQITVDINGIQVDAAHFFERIEKEMDHAAQRAAVELVNEKLSGIDGPLDQLHDVIRETHKGMLTILQNAGVEIREDDWRY